MGASHATNIFLPAGHWIGIPDNDNFKRLWKEIQTAFVPYTPWHPPPSPVLGSSQTQGSSPGKMSRPMLWLLWFQAVLIILR